MSFNSKAYLADRERLLEPESVLIKGTRKRYHEINKELVLPLDDRTEEEVEEQENDYLKSKGII